MLAQIFVYSIFAGSCVAGLFRPYWGIVGFYTFVFLDPEWNWRWSISSGAGFQKWIGVCLLAGFLLNYGSTQKLTDWAKWSVLAILGFLLIAYISGTQTASARYSEFYLAGIAKIILISVVAFKVTNSVHRAWILLWVIVIAQGYNAFRINEQYFADGFSLYAMRAWGYKGDNNLYSIFTVPVIAASLGLAIWSEKRWQQLLAGGILVLQMHQLMLMESRGTMLGALFAAGIAVVLMPKNRYTIGATGLAFFAAAVLAGPPVVEEFSSAFKPAEERDSSANSRFTLWKAGLEISLDHPLLGVGPYAGQVYVPKYVVEYSGQSVKGLHNLLFEISTGCGLPATFLYFSFFLLPWYVVVRFYRRSRDALDPKLGAICFTLACSVPGYLVASMFSSGALLESSYCVVAVCAGGYLSYTQTNSDRENALGEDEPIVDHFEES